MSRRIQTDRTEALHLLKQDVVDAAAGYLDYILLAKDKPGKRANDVALVLSQIVAKSDGCQNVTAWLATKHRCFQDEYANVGLSVAALAWGIYIGWCARACAEGKQINSTK